MPRKAQRASGERRPAEELWQALPFEQADQQVALPKIGMRNSGEEHEGGGDEEEHLYAFYETTAESNSRSKLLTSVREVTEKP